MQDTPSADEIRAAAKAFRDATVPTGGQKRAAFLARVAENALAIARREADIAPAEDAAELKRLKALLNIEGDLLTLNRELARRISTGALDLATPGLKEHLWLTTLAKLAVDQPTYSGYLSVMKERRA